MSGKEAVIDFRKLSSNLRSFEWSSLVIAADSVKSTSKITSFSLYNFIMQNIGTHPKISVIHFKQNYEMFKFQETVLGAQNLKKLLVSQNSRKLQVS